MLGVVPIEEPKPLLNETGGAGFRTILNGWLDDLVGTCVSALLDQQADWLLDGIRSMARDAHVKGLIGAWPRDGSFSKLKMARGDQG